MSESIALASRESQVGRRGEAEAGAPGIAALPLKVPLARLSVAPLDAPAACAAAPTAAGVPLPTEPSA